MRQGAGAARRGARARARVEQLRSQRSRSSGMGCAAVSRAAGEAAFTGPGPGLSGLVFVWRRGGGDAASFQDNYSPYYEVGLRTM